jgi:hypothetical protein
MGLGASMSWAGQKNGANVAMETMHDCYGELISLSELTRTYKRLYWGGGVYGDPAGPLSDLSRAYTRFSRIGVKSPESAAGDFLYLVSKQEQNSKSFDAFAKWHRQRHPDRYDQPDIVTIVSRCDQMMRQAETRGTDTPYELWRAVLSICKFTYSKEDTIKDLTGGHSDYCPEVAAVKMGDITAPFLCSTFANYEPDICRACRFYGAINSPIALGYVHEPKLLRRTAK